MPPFEGPRLRVLSIAHTAVSRSAGRLRYHPFADRPDIEVHLVVPDRWYQFGRWSEADPPDDAGVTVHVLPIRMPRAGRMLWYLHHYAGLGRLIRRLRPDVIHLWEEPWSLVAFQASVLRRRAAPDAGFVMEVDQNIMKWLPPPFESIRRHVLRCADLVLVRSDDAARVVRASGYRGPTALIGYGVADDIFRAQDRQAARASFALPGFILGYVGRIVEEKGLDDAVEALARLDGRVTLAILGEGPHSAALIEHADRLGVLDRIRIFPWAAPSRVAAFMAACDVMVLLTRTTSDVREQFGRVIVEAQACGTPVIGSSCGAIPTVVGDGGWIVPERDPAALAACVAGVRDNPAARQAAAEAGLRQVKARYTFARVAETLAEAWRCANRRRAERVEAGAPAVLHPVQRG